MQASRMLHIRRLNAALSKSQCFLRRYHGKEEINQCRDIKSRGTIASYTRFFNHDSAVESSCGDVESTTHDHRDDLRGRRYNRNVRNIGNDDVARAVENYGLFMASNAEEVERIKELVHTESTNLPTSAPDRVNFEVFGQYAYFTESEWPDYNGMDSTDGNALHDTASSGQTFFVRTMLPSCRRMNRRTRAPSSVELYGGLLRGPAQKIFSFSAIKDAYGYGVNEVEALRICPLRKGSSVIAVVHRDGGYRRSVNFMSVRRVRMGKAKHVGARNNEGIGKPMQASLSDIGEMHFLEHGTYRDDLLVPIFYTVVDFKERAWQLRRAYIILGKGVVTNDRAVYTEPDPTKYISLHKSKDGRSLFVALITHGKTDSIKCIKRSKQFKMYHIPLPPAKRVLLEHRDPYVYSIYNTQCDTPSAGTDLYMQGVLFNPSKSKSKNGIFGGGVAGVHSVICRMNDRLLRPVYAKRKGRILEQGDSLSYHNFADDGWTTVARVANTIVTDIDMMQRCLVMYSYIPPSTPRIMLLSFVHQCKISRASRARGFNRTLYDVELPIEFGVLEPQPNADFVADRVRMVLNAPGTHDVMCEIDLNKCFPDTVLGSSDVSVAGAIEHVTMPPDSVYNTAALPETSAHDCLQRLGSGVIKCDGDFPRSCICVTYANSRDGYCKIPITLVRSANEANNTPYLRFGTEAFKGEGRKCVVYVYGAYGERLQVSNDIEHNVLLKLGYTLCFAHVRGGGEFGDNWHSAGSKMCKHVGIFDLIDVMEFLLAKDIAQRNRIAVMTMSAGGILGAALYNMRPDLCSCLALKLPFLDVFNTLLDPAQPLIELEHEEFGDPKESDLDYVYSYSPCSNVLPSDYAKPSLVIQCNDEDARAPWQQSAAFISLHALQIRRIFMKISQGHHVDGSSYEEHLALTAERIAIIDHMLR